MNNSTAILASFATLKELHNSNRYKNSYQILSEFITHIILTYSLFSFTPVQMKNRLHDVFGFDIPEAVVKTASKSLSYVIKENGEFKVNRSEMGDCEYFPDMMASAESKSVSIINQIKNFIELQNPDKPVNIDSVSQDLVAFLIDDQQKSVDDYFDIIGKFILVHEHDSDIQECLDAIREGSIIYIGLNYNINETGSLRKPLVLYLDTEVLFGLAGYNGEIYKTFANDFISQVRNANSKERKITLRYFSDVKVEIEQFFKSAELIVEGRHSQKFESPAMNYILNGCATVSDIKVRQADFYHTLEFSYGITEEDFHDYYSEENHPYSLESKEYIDYQSQEGWKYISHINILRKGEFSRDNIESNYLLITNTNHILKVSQIQSEKLKKSNNLERVNDFAVSVDKITNILWYKLGNGFGKTNLPSNVKSILKAKAVLSSSISHNVAVVYKQATDQFKNGEITQEQLTARIYALRKKPLLPEELSGELIDDCMDFSAEYLSRFEEEMNSNRSALREKDEKLAQKDKIIQTQFKEKQILEQDKESLRSELAIYHERDRRKEEKKSKRKKIIRFLFSILWKIAVIGILTAIAVVLEIKLNSNIPLYICAAIDLIGIVATIVVAIKRDYFRIFSKDTDTPSIDNQETP